MNDRIDWNEYGLELAKTVALRADCTRRKVGAVLMMPDHSIAATGYNGGYSGGPSCLAGECPRGRLTTEELAANSAYDSGAGTCVALHAEWNVLLRASWEQMIGSTLYVTDEPCHLCWNLIKGTHIRNVIWPSGNIDLDVSRTAEKLLYKPSKSFQVDVGFHLKPPPVNRDFFVSIPVYLVGFGASVAVEQDYEFNEYASGDILMTIDAESLEDAEKIGISTVKQLFDASNFEEVVLYLNNGDAK